MKNKYKKTFVFTGCLFLLIYLLRKEKELRRKEKKEAEKYLSLFQLMNEWVQVKQEGKNLALFFKEQKYSRIAIYGMNYVGKTLVKELKNTDVSVEYGIDRNAQSIFSELEIKNPEDSLPEVDVIVVTPIFYYEEIESNLRGKVNCPIISIDDIIFDL